MWACLSGTLWFTRGRLLWKLTEPSLRKRKSFLDSGSSPPLASPLITQVWNHIEVMPYTTSAVYFKDNSPLWANSSYLHGLQVSAKKITEQTGDLQCGLRYNLVVLQAHLLTSQIYFLPPWNLTPHEQITTAKKWRR